MCVAAVLFPSSHTLEGYSTNTKKACIGVVPPPDQIERTLQYIVLGHGNEKFGRG